MKCEVLYGDSVDSVTWLVDVSDFRIASYSPDTLDLSLRRNSAMDFSVDVELHEDVEVSCLWTLYGDAVSEEIGNESSVNVHFPRTGDQSLTCEVSCGEDLATIAWNIHVRSCLWSWYPEALSFRVEKDSTVYFHIEPFDPASDSLSYQWMLEGEILEGDTISDLGIQFNDEAELVLMGVVIDGSEADTIQWQIDVYDPASVADKRNLIPETVSLSAPIPNPFNAVARIDYALPRASEVSLQVYDLNGRLVDNLFEGNVPGGYHSVSFDACNLSAGLYLLRLNAGGKSVIRKAVIIK